MTKGEPVDDVVWLSDLTIEYPAHGGSPAHRAVEGLNLTVGPGEVLGLVGEAGSGKSTVARIVSGDIYASTRGGVGPKVVGGDGAVLGHRLRNIRGGALLALQREVGVLPQDANASLPPDLSVGDIISSPVSRRDRRADPRGVALRVAILVDAVKLPLKVIDQYPYELSSGQRQRVAIARSLILEPSLLVADDPTAGIDITVREAVVDLVADARRHPDFAAIIVSNDLSVLRRVTTRVAVLHQGLLVGIGPLEEVLASPQHPYVAQIAAADANQGA